MSVATANRGSDVSATNEVTQAASLADAVLDAEAERQAAQEDQEVLFADDLLPGVGDEQLTLKQGLAIGGALHLRHAAHAQLRRELRGRDARACWRPTSGTASGSATA